MFIRKSVLTLLVLFLALNSKVPLPARAQTPVALDRNILIADRGNNRIIEVTPDKHVVWEFHFEGLRPGHGADDAFFSPDNTKIVANLEFENMVVVIDYATRQIIWQYGNHTPGFGPNQLYRADDAYMLPDGNITIADIGNCRVLVVAPDKTIVRRYGRTQLCLHLPGFYDRPDGATPLPNGNILITEIGSRRVSEVEPNRKALYSFIAPALYPSDAHPTQRGTIIMADYIPGGVIYETDHRGHVIWQYGPYPPNNFQHSDLNRPSLAVEMPSGNVITNDDYNHRVIVIDKKTKQIVWQYGHTGISGDAENYLDTPDGLDWRHDGQAIAAGIALPEATIAPTPASTPSN